MGRWAGRTDLVDQTERVALAVTLTSSSIGWLSMPEKITLCNVLSPKPAANMFEPGRTNGMGQHAHIQRQRTGERTVSNVVGA